MPRLGSFTGGLRLALLLMALTGAASAAMGQAALPVMKIAVLKFGTVSWELDTILRHQFDAKHGFRLETVELAGEDAAKIAFQGGAADAMLSDWIWVARQRAAGKDFIFIPYSKAVGGLDVPANSQAKSLADLKGGKIGVAGGPLDKSWLTAPGAGSAAIWF